MIDALRKYKTILLALVLVVLLYVAYSMFFDRPSSTDVLTSSSASRQQTSANNELLLLLTNLKSITLDDSVFSDPAFRGLKDFGQQLVPEPSGRNNPFAPVR